MDAVTDSGGEQLWNKGWLPRGLPRGAGQAEGAVQPCFLYEFCNGNSYKIFFLSLR